MIQSPPLSARRVFVCVAPLLLAFGMPSRLHAQRERLVARVEQLGATGVTLPSGAVSNGLLTQQAVQITLSQRLVRGGGNSVWLLGGQWRGVRASLPSARSAGTSGSASANDYTTLHTATAELMLLRTTSEKNTVVALLRPGMYGNTFRVEGAAFVDRIVSPRTTVGAGLSYGSTFGRLLPVPVVHVISRASRRVLVDALLPARADVWYMPRRGLDVGVNASLAGALYGVGTAQQINGARSLGLANATVGPQLRWSPKGGKWQFTGDAGMTILRRAEYARDGRVVADLNPGNVPYARVGLQRLF